MTKNPKLLRDLKKLRKLCRDVSEELLKYNTPEYPMPPEIAVRLTQIVAAGDAADIFAGALEKFGVPPINEAKTNGKADQKGNAGS